MTLVSKIFAHTFKKELPLPSICPWCMCCRLTTNKLGSGQFGVVYKGEWQSPSRGEVEVAVKTLKEARVRGGGQGEVPPIMGQFKHPNVVTLYGVVSEGEPVSFF